MLTTTQYVRNLIRWLLHYPTPALINKVMGVIEISDAGVKWRAISNALNTVVEDRWDTALLIAATLDEHVSVQLRDTLKGLKLHILSNSDEYKIAAEVFEFDKSQLKTVLLGGGTQAELVVARNKFITEFMDQLTIVLWFPRRADLYNIARFQANIHPATWLPYKRYEEKNGADDYWSEAYMRLHVGFHRVLPQNLSAFFVRLIKHEIIQSIEPYNRVELSAD